MKIRSVLLLSLVSVIYLFGLAGSVALPGDKTEQVRQFTRKIEFDFITWTLDALGLKLGQAALGTEYYLSSEQSPQIVLEYLALGDQIAAKEAELADIYANPDIPDPNSASINLRQALDRLYTVRTQQQPLAEAIIQGQISTIASDMGLALGGQALPPVLYHTTPPPYALIVSPRDTIRQDVNISISPDLTIDQITALEEQVDDSLNVSSLVEGVGGIGLYPTMIMQTTNLNWLVEAVAHEWVHNYLTLRPLGVNYTTSPELRVINETVASIAGKELGLAVIARYYPERLPRPTPSPEPSVGQADPQPVPQPPAFDFRAEMHTTRLEVDRLLAQGDIEEAEAYMEMRRRFFWENGYHIRKLNQAYFAFHGAYADSPGGASGSSEDPVGAAVRQLRANSTSLEAFLNRIAWMWSYQQLEQAVRQG